METISSLNTFNTDTIGLLGLSQISLPSETEFIDILNQAISMKAALIVKPSKGMWYIKGYNNNKSYEELKLHLENNIKSGYKKNSKTWLLSYNN